MISLYSMHILVYIYISLGIICTEYQLLAYTHFCIDSINERVDIDDLQTMAHHGSLMLARYN